MVGHAARARAPLPPHLTPLAALANLQILDLRDTRVTDASMLPPIRDLQLPSGATRLPRRRKS